MKILSPAPHVWLLSPVHAILQSLVAAREPPPDETVMELAQKHCDPYSTPASMYPCPRHVASHDAGVLEEVDVVYEPSARVVVQSV
jgi:hypothetical protein